jgi:hypothetical protein
MEAERKAATAMRLVPQKANSAFQDSCPVQRVFGEIMKEGGDHAFAHAQTGRPGCPVR